MSASVTEKFRGFSFIELLIVVAIVGLIATIAIPLLVSARNHAIDAKASGSLRSIVSAEASYYAANGVYGSLKDLCHPPDGQTEYLHPVFDADPADLGEGVVVAIIVSGVGHSYFATATSVGKTYITDQTGEILEGL